MNFLKDFSEEEVKNDLVTSWNEVEEAVTSLDELSWADIQDNLEAITDRLRSARDLLGKYVSETDIHGDLD